MDKIDSQKMYQIYDKWPEIALENYQEKYEMIHFNNISHIVFAGMGGSGAIGDIFSSILSRSKIHVTVVKGYLLPNTVDNETLVVTTSISGNTIETLTVLEDAMKKGAKIIAFSSGGKMKNFCLEHKINYREIPMIHSPRASFTCFLYSMLKILEPILPIADEEILNSIKLLEQTKKRIFSNNLTESNISLELAKWINNIPIIYFPAGLQSAAIRFKNSLQENAKIHAITEDIIESCHNGIVSWEKNSNVNPILIEGEDDYIRTKERWSILKKFLQTKKIEYFEIKTVKGGILSKIINLIYQLDYASIYLAALSKIDPTPVESIDFIKKELEK